MYKRQASVIKAFLLAALYLQAERGMADLSAEIEYEASRDAEPLMRKLLNVVLTSPETVSYTHL